MFWKKQPPPAKEQKPRQSIFSTDPQHIPKGTTGHDLIAQHFKQATGHSGAMDSATGHVPEFKQRLTWVNVPEAVVSWFASQTNIGVHLSAVMAQHWLVQKACYRPVEDALRVGYEVKLSEDIEDPDSLLKAIKKNDKRRKIHLHMKKQCQDARVYGVAYALFKVLSTDPEYYEKPFNIDGVAPGSYEGIAHIDPMYIVPALESATTSDPTSLNFYDPLYYIIGGEKYHRSHFVKYVPYEVQNSLKPVYYFGGVSVPQRIYERVYAAERTANEAPILAMTKRTFIFKTDAVAFFGDLKAGVERLAQWIGLMDNHGALVVDKEGEDLNKHETSLADLDAVIMNQFQLVAAAAEMPATKLLETQPKGFNATGEMEAENYRVLLEGIQQNGALPVLERHHQIAMRSDIAPRMHIKPLETDVDWMPLDSPTAKEWAEIQKLKMDTMVAAAGQGAIDGMDIREIVTRDKDSDFYGLAEIKETEEITYPEVENGNA